MVLRLHHVKPVKDAVHRNYWQIHTARLSAQDRGFQGIHQSVTEWLLFRCCHPERSASACERAVEGSMYFERWYYVYIMSNRSKTLYIGITGKFTLRVFQHKSGVFKGFTSRYRMDRLVYWEKFKRVNDAIAREKQLKGWTRIKKIQLIVGMNPTWEDLAEGWFPELKEKENA